MVRSYRIKKNGESFQLFDLQGYAGSITLPELCQLLRNQRKTGTNTKLAQNPVKEVPQAH